jgi:uncharacterized protein YpmS
MRAFWRWAFRIVVALVLVAAVGAFAFRKQISEYRAALE